MRPGWVALKQCTSLLRTFTMLLNQIIRNALLQSPHNASEYCEYKRMYALYERMFARRHAIAPWPGVGLLTSENDSIKVNRCGLLNGDWANWERLYDYLSERCAPTAKTTAKNGGRFASRCRVQRERLGSSQELAQLITIRLTSSSAAAFTDSIDCVRAIEQFSGDCCVESSIWGLLMKCRFGSSAKAAPLEACREVEKQRFAQRAISVTITSLCKQLDCDAVRGRRRKSLCFRRHPSHGDRRRTVRARRVALSARTGVRREEAAGLSGQMSVAARPLGAFGCTIDWRWSGEW